MSRRQPTHEKIVGTNRGEIISWMSEFPQEIPGQLAAGLSRLGKDGGFNDIHVYYRIYQIPPGTVQGREIDPQEWIEAAGTADRLTVEVKRRDADGVHRLYTVGRPGAANEGQTSETLRFTFTEAHVCPSEVLTAAEAIGIFQHYYDHHQIPVDWELRETESAVSILAPEAATTSSAAPASAMSAGVSNDRLSTPGAIAGYSDSAIQGQLAKAEEQDAQRRADNT
ncbi:MAG: hypothetical protein ACRC20_01790 [Segniliparus sp.]|uniref:hypothetical protein n=1 Tax=Segniliparus sp. TaxID=2804064 RepID=UPI003F3F8FFA